MTSTENQKKDEKGKTNINLGECEKNLKKEYNLSEEEILYILKVDFQISELTKTIVEYEVYFPFNGKNLTLLNLTVCKNDQIFINVPASLKGDFKIHDKNSDYYNNLCCPATSDSGTDMCLNDRRREYTEKGLNLCEPNCILVGYIEETEKAKCSCPVKQSMNIKEIVNPELLKDIFNLTKAFVNFYVVKCYDYVFKLNNLANNYGIYPFISVFVLTIIKYSLFKKQFEKLKDKIHRIAWAWVEGVKLKIKDPNNNQNPNEKKNINNNSRNNNNYVSLNALSRNEENIIKKMEVIEMILRLTDNEKNNFLSYEKAFKLDQRKFLATYISFIKTEHIFFSCFFNYDDYNILIIKIYIFFFFFALHFTVNALFFNDKTMHQIYEDKGAFTLIFHLPQIILSTIISAVVKIIIKIFGLSDKSVIKFKMAKKLDEHGLYKTEIQKLIFALKIKFAIFFIMTIILTLAFQYYILCFCGTFKNTQIILITDTFISFGTSLVYPIILLIFPVALRRYSLGDRNRQCSYKLSNIALLIC